MEAREGAGCSSGRCCGVGVGDLKGKVDMVSEVGVGDLDTGSGFRTGVETDGYIWVLRVGVLDLTGQGDLSSGNLPDHGDLSSGRFPDHGALSSGRFPGHSGCLTGTLFGIKGILSGTTSVG